MRGIAALVGPLCASAYLMSLAIASPAHWWLGWVTLIPLFHAIRVLRPGLAAAACSFWGVVLFACAAGAPGSTVSASLGSFALLAAIPAGYGYLGAWLTRRVGFSPYLLALCWVGVEFALRPVGFDHGLLAGTQGDGFAIRIIGSFAGYVLVAFLVAYVNAALLNVLSEVRWASARRRPIYGGRTVPRRVVPSSVPPFLRDFIRELKPRGPPALVPAVAVRRD